MSVKEVDNDPDVKLSHTDYMAKIEQAKAQRRKAKSKWYVSDASKVFVSDEE
jgi:hypothetical protein